MTLLQQIEHLGRPTDRPLVIAISGFGGSGKTTLAERLKERLHDATIVSIDSFSNHEWARNADWSNFDRQRFAEEVLKPARANDFPLLYRHEPWPGQVSDAAVAVTRANVLIVEGCSIFHPDLIKYYDFKIWLDCPLEEATKRGMWRDRYINKNQMDHYWQNIWMPNEKDFFEKYNPHLVADVIVSTAEV